MDFKEYQDKVSQQQIAGLPKVQLPIYRITSSIGDISSTLVSSITCNKCKLSESNKADIKCSLGEILYSITCLATDLKIDLSSIADFSLGNEDISKKD